MTELALYHLKSVASRVRRSVCHPIGAFLLLLNPHQLFDDGTDVTTEQNVW